MFGPNNGCICFNTARHYIEKTVSSESKGTTQYSDITANSSSTYPSNGKSGSYWYVYKGVQ